MKFIEENMVLFDVQVEGPEEAIQKAGQLLVDSGCVDSAYVTAMIESYQENGPYFVLAPHIALPHARPEDGGKEASVSFMRLTTPVKFGHKSNDPVEFVFALGASSSDEHIQVLQKLSSVLGNQDKIKQLKEVSNFEELQKILDVGGNKQ
ncbi:PTS sugar transporter subunit IIA [Salirhabdus salicampi]|uniref:PTS sugar transporter subunit IIA n=1 Tax=Salirhabdus salicampi TaxID=476102 RepID=UPI0020C5183A|nr:PTS sugar transporter subunit IIA [Salirhabdus salicampi]MCP8617333.1 PTS sugar transporter subunit IIA [Salirhabdus salicampi]